VPRMASRAGEGVWAGMGKILTEVNGWPERPA
jgi:hypothetical protein